MINQFVGKYRFLSNFYPGAVVELEGLKYATVEHAYQAAKTTRPWERRKIHLCTTPGQAKRLGRCIVLRPEWADESFRIETMRMLLEQKFSDERLLHALAATARRQLIEGNTWGDEFWGVCNGKGQNHLGRLLMDIRSDIIHGV